MVARRSLYSVRLDERRRVPRFQFRRSDSLVANVGQVNAALPPDLHPTSVHGWSTRPDADLVVDEQDAGPGMTPLE